MREGEKPIYEISLLPGNIRFGVLLFTKPSNSCKTSINWKSDPVLQYRIKIRTEKYAKVNPKALFFQHFNIVRKSELCQDNPFYGLRLYKGSTFIYV